MTHSCALCEDEFNSDQDRVSVGKQYICQSCCETSIAESMDELAMALNSIFGMTEFEIARAA